ncbi:peptidoglycan/xylan/chitin deacetylase (PgdA/CDA1 family) [Rhizobium sp. SG_E_25_P2]|uniref:polysaccharide deacetylase n=1 Tax=Rhizobium sp. SG_E_25_P2 TaxID=2879942 RepID=UPI002474325A|nr:polysaccharide deacetylase [Rhizobium sp. SG_E_25_P2]MDH6267096.1 peptidoglycan/xylan/chitin deacetylase (PgdA/CDA1 family) [Rhizobium sp. SG_E_25_P2]
MRLTSCLAFSLALTTAPALADPPHRPKQLVLISFDGAHDNRLWERSLALSKRTGAKFTYFLSCTYLINPADRKTYRAPHHAAGKSATGWALTVPEIQARLGHIWQAHLDGHDIGSHACGHFDGKDWTRADWSAEFSAFDDALLNAWARNGVKDKEPEGWVDFVRTDITGFRAPYLSTSPGLTPALSDHGFRFDASLVSKGPAEPEREGGLMRFALPRIPEGPEGRLIIGMDYNLYVRHSGGLNSPGRAPQFKARTLAAFRNAFETQYQGKRIPLQLGFHFVEMNGGAYWDALETFLGETCAKKDVACVSYTQAMDMRGTVGASGL